MPQSAYSGEEEEEEEDLEGDEEDEPKETYPSTAYEDPYASYGQVQWSDAPTSRHHSEIAAKDVVPSSFFDTPGEDYFHDGSFRY